MSRNQKIKVGGDGSCEGGCEGGGERGSGGGGKGVKVWVVVVWWND